MPIIVMSNPKGGVGKSTATLCLATHLAAHGAQVTVLDADPNRPIADWRNKGSSASTIKVVEGITQDNIIDHITAQQSQFTLIDLEGTANLIVTRSISYADFVIVPVQASAVDVRQASKAIRVIRDEERALRNRNPDVRIPYKLLMTRTNAPGAPVSSVHRQLEAEIAAQNLPRFKTTMVERQAFKALFVERLTLSELAAKAAADKSFKVGNVQAAIENVEALVHELLDNIQNDSTISSKNAEEGVVDV
jgi:chromosome partitioning protein